MVIQSVVPLVFAVGLALVVTDLVNGKVVSVWVGLALVVGGLATVFLSPVFFVPGLAWSLLWIVVWRRTEQDVAIAATR